MKNIGNFTKPPELLEIVLDGEDIVHEYGEPIVFWMKDFVDITTYFNFYRAQSEGNSGVLDDILRTLILDKNGKPAIKEGHALPVDIAVGALSKINENLGKLKTKPSTSTIGNQPA